MQTIQLSEKLFQQADANARSGGFASVTDYVEQILEKEFAKTKETDSEEQKENDELVRKMEAAGYLDEGLDI